MASATHRNDAYHHELVLHDGTPDLVALMVPFLREAPAAGDQVVVVGQAYFVESLLSEVPEVPTVRIIDEPGRGRFPGRDMDRIHQLLLRLDTARSRVRMVNQMPALTLAQWLEWRRYEAAINVHLAPLRVWGMCAYDRGGLHATVLSELRAAHPYVYASTGHSLSPDFSDVDDYTSGYMERPPHPAMGTEPAVSLLEPTAAAARQVVRALAVSAGLSLTAQECAILAASESVTNGRIHGRPPVGLRVWVQPGRMTVAVSDGGSGPPPLVGMFPVRNDGRPSGRSMWMLHLLLGEVHHRTSSDGYTITFDLDADTALPTPTPQHSWN